MRLKVPLTFAAAATLLFVSSPSRTFAQASQQPTATPKPASVDPLALELSFWQTIKDSKNPEDFKAYLKKFPNGEFAELAKIRINSIGASGPESSAFDQLLAGHIRALGDKAAIENIKTLVLRGTVEITLNGQRVSGTTERLFKYPEKSFVLISAPFGTLTQGFDGVTGWKNSGSGAVTMNAWETAFQNRTNLVCTHITHVDQFKSAYKSFLVRGKLDLDGREVQVVDAEPLNGQRETLYFDAGTGLLYRWDVISEGDGATKLPTQLYADEYVTVEGVKVPARIHVVTPTATISSRFNEIKANVEIDDTKFQKH